MTLLLKTVLAFINASTLDKVLTLILLILLMQFMLLPMIVKWCTH